MTHFRVPRVPAQPTAVAADMSGMPGAGGPAMAGDVPPPPVPTGSGALHWTLPGGWTEAQGGGRMRYATLTVPVSGKLDVSVVVLPGSAGGELANVNRWRGQIGLPPLGEAGLAPARRALRAPVGEVSLYDFVSGGTQKTRTVAGCTSLQGNSWFVKMTGDAAAVGAARPAFLDLLGSLRLDDAR